jgi:multiple sugar transport system permease protein
MTATAVVDAPGKSGTAPRRTRWNPAPRHTPHAFLVPAVVLFTAVFLVPLGYTFYLSTQKTQIQGLGLGRDARKQVFTGFGNYTAVFHDAEFWHSILRALLYGCILIPLMLGLATIFALILDAQRVRFQRFGRIAIFLPYAVPTIIGSMLWGMMYLPSVSPFVSVMHTLFGVTSVNFFGSHAVYLSIANIGIWGGTGFNMMVLYTSLRSLPHQAADDPAFRHHDRDLLDDRHAAGLQRTQYPATSLLRSRLRHLDPADEGVSRHVHRRRRVRRVG